MAVGSAYLFPPLWSGGASMAEPLLRFPSPLTEPDVPISGIRLCASEGEKHFPSITASRVEEGRGGGRLPVAKAGAFAAAPQSGLPWPRFPSPLIEPDVPISGIRLSDWLHRKAHGGRPS